MEEKTRTLLIIHENGNETQIDIPESWKVTFGLASPGAEHVKGGKVGLALRIYETEKMQRAIFTDVVSFRDMSIPIRIKKVNVQEKDGFMECDGVRKRTTFQASTTEWVSPDVDNSNNATPKLAMPSDQEVFGNKDE